MALMTATFPVNASRSGRHGPASDPEAFQGLFQFADRFGGNGGAVQAAKHRAADGTDTQCHHHIASRYGHDDLSLRRSHLDD
jgi:hypothetical protein